MRRRRHPHLTRQHHTQLLQSVAIFPGTGKSHLLVALGAAAVQAGHKVRYYTAADLAQLIGLGLAACEQGRRARYATTAALDGELVEAADQRALSRIVGRYGRLDLLLLDELGYVQVDPRGAELLFQIITERDERASIAIGTNLPFSEWGTVFPDPRLVAAIVDRVTFNAHILETGTQSYRLRTSKTTSRGKKPS
jgi:DNA replication protein DnaC